MGYKLIKKDEAIKVMESNLRKIKECSDSDTFLVLGYDLGINKSFGKRRLNLEEGKKLANNTKTFILNNDLDEDSVSILSFYSVLQKDIYNIVPKGFKHDILLLVQFPN